MDWLKRLFRKPQVVRREVRPIPYRARVVTEWLDDGTRRGTLEIFNVEGVVWYREDVTDDALLMGD